MRLRVPLVAGSLVAALVVAAAASWPLLSARVVSEVESRLARETGRTWKVAGGLGAGLDPAPYLALRDLSTDRRPGAYEASVGELRVQGIAGLLFGNAAGTLQLHAETVRVRVPTGAGLRLSGGTGGLGPVRSLRAKLEGASAALDDKAGVATLSLASADATLEIGPETGRSTVNAALDGPDYAASLDLDLAASGGPLRLSLTPKSGAGHRLEASATLASRPSGFRLDGLSGRFDGEPFSGSVSLEDGPARPRLGLDLRLKALSLTDADAAPASRPNAAEAGLVVPVRTDLVPDPRWFTGFDAQASIALGRLGLGPARVEGVSVKATVKDAALDMAVTAESVYEGGARARYVLASEGDGALHQASLSLSGIKAAPLLGDLVSVRAIDGTGTARIDVQARGLTRDALARSAKGAADIRLRDGRIDGLDLASLAGLIGTDASGRRASGLITAFSELGATFRIDEGRAATDDLALKTSLIEAKGVGDIDLVGRGIDMTLTPTLMAQGRPGSAGRKGLTVPVRIRGPWTGASVSVDVSGVAGDPQGALGALQELGGSLLGGQGFGGQGIGGGRPGGGNGGGRDGGNGGDDIGGGLGGLLDSLIGGGRPMRPEGGRR